MKRTILILSLFLFACSQEIPLTAVPFVSPTAAPIETSLPTQPPVLEITSTVESFPPASALPAGPVTLVAIGDSLTAGDGDDSGRGYTGRLLDLVSPLRPDTQVTNLGRSGWSSDALINGDQSFTGQLPRAVSELDAARSQKRGAVALVWIGSNDLWYLYEYGDGSDENDRLDVQRFSANMDTILSQLRGAGAQVIIALLDDQSKRPIALRGEAFTAITPDELNRMSAQVVRYNKIITEKAAQYGALTVDFYSTDIFTNPATLYDDGNHPNSAGYDIVAQKWFDILKGLLN
jgi:lysophospholipase L1-like esterase